MSFMDHPSVTIISSRPKSGKSYLIKYLCYYVTQNKIVDNIYCFTGTAFSNDYNYLPKHSVTSTYNIEKVKAIVRYQINRIKKGKAKNILIVFDDVMGLKKEMKEPMWAKLISEYRHYKISFIFSVQYIKGITTPLFRSCTRYVILFRTLDNTSVKSLYESFMMDMPSIKGTYNFISRNTEMKYNFIFIDRYADDNEKYSVLRAPEKLPNYKIKF